MGPTVPVPCLKVCGFVVAGADADLKRFQEEAGWADLIFRQCGVRIAGVGFQRLENPAWLDHSDIRSQTLSESTQQMFEEAGARSGGAHVVMVYVRSLGSGTAGCSSRRLAAGRPGFLVSEKASRNTFAHELGHILFGGFHSSDRTNLMFSPSADITVSLPRLNDRQYLAAAHSPYVSQCGPAEQLFRPGPVGMRWPAADWLV